MTKPPKPPRKLFQIVRNDENNYYPFLTHNPAESTHYFGRGFHDAGDDLVSLYKDKGMPDYVAPPIVFLYRQAAELYLKGIIWNGDEVLTFLKKPTSGVSPKTMASHTLMLLLPFVETIQKAFGIKWDEAESVPYGDAVEMLKEFEKYDPGSYSFRYPSSKKGQPSHPPDFGFNLMAFAKPWSKALNEWWDTGLAIEGIREHHTMV